MKSALEQLGYTPYHMSECIRHWKDHHLHYWDEALRAKYRAQGKPYGRPEFDKIFKGYDVGPKTPLFRSEMLSDIVP